jgi:cell division protein FtsB
MFSKIAGSKILFLVMILILGYLGYALVNIFLEKKIIDNRLASLRSEVEEMELYRAEIKKNKEYYSSQDFLEKEARRLLNYQKPDEEVIAVIPNKNSQISEEKTITKKEKVQQKNIEELSNPEKWQQYFFGARD